MIKFIAAISMLVDHIGFVFFPHVIWFRVIGRLAMPMFAFAMARAFSSVDINNPMEDNKAKKYFFRLLIFSIISQIPYQFMFGYGFNIGFTWLIGFLILYTYTHHKNYKGIFIIIFLLLFPASTAISYGISGVLYPLMLYLCIYRKKSYNYAILGSIILYGIYIIQYQMNIVQMAAIVAVPLIMLLIKKDNIIRLNKWFYYAFYPVHMAILVIIKYFLI